jgi:DNA-binding MltR family transcriptional regulator
MSKKHIASAKRTIEVMVEFPKNLTPGALRGLKADRIRSMVISSDVGLDYMLGLCLKMTFCRRVNENEVKKLFDPYANGILVSLVQKARIAYALELIDKTTFTDIMHLHRIRNVVAHKGRAKFADPDISKPCMKLSTATKIKKYNTNKGLLFFCAAHDKCFHRLWDSIDKLQKKDTFTGWQPFFLLNP